MQRTLVPRLYAPRQSSGGTMQREAEHIESLRKSNTTRERWHRKQGGQRPSGPSCRDSWSYTEVKIFLQEWKAVEMIIGHPGSKIYQKSWAIYQRLHGLRGLKKSWESCVDLLLTLKKLHRRLCRRKPDTIPLFSPYSEDLYSILGSSPCPLYREDFGNHLPPVNPQPSRDRPGDHGTPGPSTKLQENPMISQGDSPFLWLETQKHCCQSSAPHLLPAFDSGTWEDMENFLEFEAILQSAEREAEHIESLGKSNTTRERWHRKQGGQRPSGPSCRDSWSYTEVKIFLQEWKAVEMIIGHPGSKIYQKSWAIYQRLHGLRGLKKSWESCVDLLLTLKKLHRRLCRRKPDTIPLFSPYSEDLYSILGSSPCPLYRDDFGNHLPPVNPQPSRDRPGDHGTPGPSTKLQENPMMSQADSPFLWLETQKHCCPSSAPHLLPAWDPGLWGLQHQQPWSTSD